jgi:hypothetical protein
VSILHLLDVDLFALGARRFKGGHGGCCACSMCVLYVFVDRGDHGATNAKMVNSSLTRVEVASVRLLIADCCRVQSSLTLSAQVRKMGGMNGKSAFHAGL